MIMNIEKINDNSVVALMPQRVDASNAHLIDDEFKELFNTGIKKILIDFSDNMYLSSAGIRNILAAYKKVNSISGKIALACLKPQVKNTLELTGFSFFKEKLPFFNTIIEGKVFLSV